MPLILDNILFFLCRVLADAIRSSICQQWPVVKGSIGWIDSPKHERYPYAEIHYCYEIDGAHYEDRCLRGFWWSGSANDYAARYNKLTSLQVRYHAKKPYRSYLLDKDQFLEKDRFSM